jgi:hypothetical protein
VPPVVPESEAEKRRFQDAGRRREIRQAEKARKRRANEAPAPEQA